MSFTRSVTGKVKNSNQSCVIHSCDLQPVRTSFQKSVCLINMQKGAGRSDGLLFKESIAERKNQDLAEAARNRSKNYSKSCFEFDFVEDFVNFKQEKLS